jgi:hypothetical protein
MTEDPRPNTAVQARVDADGGALRGEHYPVRRPRIRQLLLHRRHRLRRHVRARRQRRGLGGLPRGEMTTVV